MIARRRSELDHSYAQAGVQMHSSGQSVANWEEGRLPLREKLPAIADYLGLKLETIERARLQPRKGRA